MNDQAFTIATPANALNGDDKDQQLRDDIRHLGRILGDTVRTQHGEEIFNIIETVRQNSIRFGRDGQESDMRRCRAGRAGDEPRSSRGQGEAS